MALHPRMLDRAADALRHAHLRRQGVAIKDALPWSQLQASEQEQWRAAAANTKPAE